MNGSIEPEIANRTTLMGTVINQNIQRTTSLEDLLEVATRELSQAIGAQRTSVQLSLGGDGDLMRG